MTPDKTTAIRQEPSIRKAARALCAIAAAVATACGGGGESAPAPAPRDTGVAVAGGTIERAENSSFIVVRPGGGTTWLFYGPDLATAPRVTGYIYTHGSYATDGDGAHYNATDSAQAFGYGASLEVAVDPLAPAVAGSLRYRGDTTNYKLAGGPVPGSSYRYDRTANVAEAVGNWTLSDVGGNAVALSVRTDGGIGGTYLGCALTGQLTPTAGNSNRMDLVASLIACPGSGPVSTEYRGIAVAFPMTAGGTQLLLLATNDFEEGLGVMFAIGRR